MKNRKSGVLACIILLAFMAMIPLSARDMVWSWSSCAEDRFTAYRYQLDARLPDKWIEVSSDITEVNLPDNGESVMYIQSTEDGYVWSDLAIGYYRPSVERTHYLGARLSLSPYSISIFDFYNGHDIKDAKFLTMSNYSAAIDAELFWKTPWPLALHLDAGYSIALKGETVIPNALDVHHVRLGGGIDLALSNDKVFFSLGVLGGELITFNADHWNPGSYLGGRVLLEFNLNENLHVGCQSRVTVSYQKSSDPLMSSLTWMVDPLVIGITYRF